MLQQNNNNNYSCLQRTRGNGEILQKGEKGSLPFAGGTQDGGSAPGLGSVSFPAPVKSFRAWVVSGACSSRQRRAPLIQGDPGPCLGVAGGITACWMNQHKHTGSYPRAQRGRLAKGRASTRLVLQVDALDSCCHRGLGNGNGSVGELVTVATLKASEGGSQTQTQCFVLQAERHHFLCAPGRRYNSTASLSAEVPCTLEKNPSVNMEASGSIPSQKGQHSGMPGIFKVKPRSFRKWRTSCEVAFSGTEGAPTDCEGDDFLDSQKNRSRQQSQASQKDVLAWEKQGQNQGSQCRVVQGVVNQKGTAAENSWPSGSVNEKPAKPESSPPSGSVSPKHTDPQHPRSAGSQCFQATADVQEGLQPKSFAVEVSRFQGLLEDKGPTLITDSVGDASAPEKRTAGESAGPLGPDQMGHGTSCRMRAKVSRSWVSTEVPERHSCMETRSSERECRPCFGVHLGSSDTGGNGQLPRADDRHGWVEQASDLVAYLVGDAVRRGTGLVSGITLQQGSPVTELGDPQGDRAEASGDDGSREPWGGWLGTGHNRAGAEEPQSGALWSTPSWDGERRREAEESDLILQSGDSPSRGPALAVAANPPPPGTMATALSAPGRWQAEVGGGTLALASVEEQLPWGWDGGMVASGGGLDTDQEGDDDFGLFVQAGEQSSWNDGFEDFHQVSCGEHESRALANYIAESQPAVWMSGTTENLSHQSEGTWAAFQQADEICLGKGLGAQLPDPSEGQWWPQSALEKQQDKEAASLHVIGLFQEAFPLTAPACGYSDCVHTLSELLQGRPPENHGSLLGRLQDVNRAIGLKYKWAESHSYKLLLQSLRLDQYNKDHLTSYRLAKDSPSLSLSMFSQQTPPMGNGRANKKALA